MSAVPACPDCAGPWLNGWRWQHHPTDCPLRAAEDATQAADAERLRTLGGATFTRPATAGEARLWLAVTGSALPRRATTTVPDVAKGVWVRQINQHFSAADAA